MHVCTKNLTSVNFVYANQILRAIITSFHLIYIAYWGITLMNDSTRARANESLKAFAGN